jgi:hypothetical protein
MTNTNKHDANKHVPKDKHEQIHEDKQWGAPEGEKGCKGREEEERMQMTCIHEVSPLCHAYPLTMYVNRAMARAVSGSGNNDTVVATPIAPSQPYQHSTTCNRTGPNPHRPNCRRNRPSQYGYRLLLYPYCTVWPFCRAIYWVK